MPFAITNAPNTFMHLINDIFGPYMGKFGVVYLDGILIFSQTWEEHVQYVQLTLNLPRTHCLKVKLNKYYFGQTSIPYLGFLIDNIGIKIDLVKIVTLPQWPTLTSMGDMKSFLVD